MGSEKLRESGLLKPKIEIKHLSPLVHAARRPAAGNRYPMGPPLDTRKLQLIDRWIGVLVCGVLSGIRRLSRSTGVGSLPRKPKKILFVKFAEQGSTVLAYHAIRRAIEMVGA